MIAFGPIPSRRLGRSLGINNIPPKNCSYACLYCQIGPTNMLSMSRKEFYKPEIILAEVEEKISSLSAAGEALDYITFVPDGEPSLDKRLGRTIEKLKKFGIKIAVITNASLLWMEEVREEMQMADWVSVKIDSAYENIWKKINRPHGMLLFADIIKGIEKFAESYKGFFATETMLLRGLNDSIESLNKTAQLIKMLEPDTAYLLVPTRPPVESIALPPKTESLENAIQIFGGLVRKVEVIAGNEGNDFTYLNSVETELLNILAVHPMRIEAVLEFLAKSGEGMDLIEKMKNERKIKDVTYLDNKFITKI